MKKILVLIVVLAAVSFAQERGVIDAGKQVSLKDNERAIENSVYGRFNGVDNYLRTKGIQFEEEYTFAIMIKFPIPLTEHLFNGGYIAGSKNNVAGHPIILAYDKSENTLKAICYDSESVREVVITDVNELISIGEWHTLIATNMRSGALNLYLDGKLIGTSNTLLNHSIAVVRDVVVGSRSDDNNYMNQYVKRLLMFNYEMTIDEVGELHKNLMNGTYEPEYANIIEVYPKFDDTFDSDVTGVTGRYSTITYKDSISDGTTTKYGVVEYKANPAGNQPSIQTAFYPKVGVEYYLDVNYYIPDSNSVIEFFFLGNNGLFQDGILAPYLSVKGEWARYYQKGKFVDEVSFTRFATLNNTPTSDEVAYIDYIRLVQLGVILDLRFDEGAGYIIRDHSGNDNDGVLYGQYESFWKNPPRNNEYSITLQQIDLSLVGTVPYFLFDLPQGYELKSINAFVDSTVSNADSLFIGSQSYTNEVVSGELTASEISSANELDVLQGFFSPNDKYSVYLKTNAANASGRLTIIATIKRR